MSNYGQLDGAALDRHITGNYGEDQFKGSIECPKCEGQGEVVIDACLCPVAMRGDECYISCQRCERSGWIDEELLMDPGDDPDRKYDEERDRRIFGIDAPDGASE